MVRLGFCFAVSRILLHQAILVPLSKKRLDCAVVDRINVFFPRWLFDPQLDAIANFVCSHFEGRYGRVHEQVNAVYNVELIIIQRLGIGGQRRITN